MPFNFTNLNDPQPSMLSSLYNQSLIPSRSWAYTAGAHYNNPPVFGSLTLGGFDTTRFRPNDLSFSFGADFSRDLLVSLQSVTYDTAGSSPLLASSIDIFIDSLVTEIWLPVNACEAFARQFNLTVCKFPGFCFLFAPFAILIAHFECLGSCGSFRIGDDIRQASENFPIEQC